MFFTQSVSRSKFEIHIYINIYACIHIYIMYICTSISIVHLSIEYIMTHSYVHVSLLWSTHIKNYVTFV